MEAIEALHEIVAADAAARARLEEAYRRLKRLESGAEDVRAAVREAAMGRAREQAAAAQAEAERKAQAELAALDEAYARERAALEALFEERKDACADEIFRRTVGLL